MENAQNRNPQSRANQNPQSNTPGNTSTSGISGQSQSGQPQSQSHTSGISGQSQSRTSGVSGQSGTSGKGGLGNITDKLQQFSNTTLNKVNNLSTTQKVVGGSLLALGAGWLTMNSMNKNKEKTGNKANKNVNKR